MFPWLAIPHTHLFSLPPQVFALLPFSSRLLQHFTFLQYMLHSLSLYHFEKISKISHIWKWSVTGLHISAKHKLKFCIVWYISDSLKVWSTVLIFICKLDPCNLHSMVGEIFMIINTSLGQVEIFFIFYSTTIQCAWCLGPQLLKIFDISRVSMNDTSTSFTAVSLKTWQSLATTVPCHSAGITSQWNHFSLEHKCLYFCSFHHNLACSYE